MQRGDAFRSSVELAVRIAFALVLEEIVGDAHFDVVGFAGEQQQRLVLRLPAESRDRGVVSIDIEVSGNTQRSLLLGIGRQRRLKRAVRDVLHQAKSVHRCGYPKYNVVAGNLGRKIGLLDVAARCIRPSRDHEQTMHAAIRRAVRIAHEARLANRTGGCDEGWQNVLGAGRGRDRDLRVGGRTGAPDCRVRMATGTAVEIETRAQALGNRIDFLENIFRAVEKQTFSIVEARQCTSRSGISASHTRIGWPATRRCAAGVIVLTAGRCINSHRVGVRGCRICVCTCRVHICS